jgi:hypothetical protein
MDVGEMQKKIEIVELARRDAGTEQTLDAIIDVLKEFARVLETYGKST